MKQKVNEMFRKFIKEKTNKELSKIDIAIYGVELQLCGGLLKYLDDTVKVTLVHDDLRVVGNIYDGHECKLTEDCMPYEENTIVLFSMLYEYQCESAMKRMQSLGVQKENMLWVRDFSEKLLQLTAEYFAAKGMDSVVYEMFEKIGKAPKNVKYLDVGANNYLLYNNTYLFYRAGATGVLVEANPDFSRILKDNRPRDIVLICGCSSTEDAGCMTYYKTNRAGYNTFVAERAKKLDGTNANGVKVVDEIPVPMRSINSVIEEYFPDGRVDYLSVDIEGMGAEVVNAIDFERYQVDIILIEMEYNTDSSRNLYKKLCSLGYKMRYRGIGGDKDFLFYKKSVFSTT